MHELEAIQCEGSLYLIRLRTSIRNLLPNIAKLLIFHTELGKKGMAVNTSDLGSATKRLFNNPSFEVRQMPRNNSSVACAWPTSGRRSSRPAGTHRTLQDVP
jgi:hypothetical protein